MFSIVLALSASITYNYPMNRANPSFAKTEIIKQLGCFPAFLFPAINSSLVYQSLVDQTLFAYVNNPLPPQFKEKLFVVLSRYYGITYFTICHSCTLRSLGLSAANVLALGELQYPRSEADVIGDLELLSCQWRKGRGWNNSLELEVSLLRCACLLFLYPEQTASLSASLKDLLGTVYYHYLIVLLGYIKLCHQWFKSNNGINHQQDRRSQLYLGSLLLEEIKLAQFFQTTPQSPSVFKTYHQPASSQPLVDKAISHSAAVKVATPQLRQKTLTTCLANAPFPVMIHNRQGKIIHLNRNWLEASGYSLKEISTIEGWNQKAQIEQREIVKLTAKNPSQLNQKYVAPAHQTALEATSTLQQIIDSLIEITPETTKSKVQAARRLTEAIRSEVTGTTRSGDRFYWELYSTALSFESETDELVISIAKDITELVHYEAKSAEVEAKLRLVLEATKTGTWSWDLTTNRVDVCRQGRIILGLENFDGSYENFLQSIHPNERESIDLEIARAIQADRDLNIKYSVVKSDGQVSLIHAKGRLNYNSLKQPVIEGVLTDLTSSQIASADIPSLSSVADKTPAANCSLAFTNMAQSLSELKTVIDLLPCYLFVVNIKTEAISLINTGLTNSLNLSKQEVMGKTIADCFPDEYVQHIALQHQQAIDSQQVLQIQEEVTLPDGIHYFDTVVTPLYDDSGDIYGLLHTCRDIPNFAATQEALSQRTNQLEAANRELESFSYSVSHDLQAPLRIINGFSQVLQENYQANLDERGKHYLQRIQANSKRMSDLIDALLQLSRVTRSQMKPVEVNLSAIAQDIMEELRADNSQRQVETKIAPSAKAKGDPQLLRIVLNNLLHNAWKYTSKRSQTQIEFGVVATAATTFFVKDNGAGFDPEYADKLFVPFQRLHSQAEFPGTGIGLATVQRIIYRHGGKVWAEGEKDAGATIYFSL